MADLYDLLVAPDEVSAQEQAQALSAALRRQKAVGMLGAFSGDKVLAPLGQQMMQGGDQTERGMLGVAQGRLTRAMQAQAARADAAQAEREFGLRQAGQREQARHARAMEQQGAWEIEPGLGVMLNRRTGETRPLSADILERLRQQPQAASPVAARAMESDIQKLGTDLESVAKLKPDLDTLDKAAQADDMDGFGPLAGRMPEMLTSEEGIANRQAAGRIMANILSMISGAAVSEGEVERQLEARGLGKTASPAAFKQGLSALQSEALEVARNREAKYRPEVIEEYARRGGFTSRKLGQPKARPAGDAGGDINLAAAGGMTKTIGSKTYQKTADGWIEVD